MTATSNSGLGHGTNGAPQGAFEEQTYSEKVSANEDSVQQQTPPAYVPSPKHEPGHNWGSEDPIKSHSEGQRLLDTGYKHGRQIYNVTNDGHIVKFQPDGTHQNGYHAYSVTSPRDIPAPILKKLRDDGKISKSDYNKYRKGKK